MIQLIEKLLVIQNFGPTARNALKLSILSGTLFWRYLNSSFISGHVRSLLYMRYRTAWFASIVHCNVKKAIVALWRATLCSVPSFSDWWVGCLKKKLFLKYRCSGLRLIWFTWSWRVQWCHFYWNWRWFRGCAKSLKFLCLGLYLSLWTLEQTAFQC